MTKCGELEADLIIAGDLFDKSHPTLQELKIAFQFFNLLNRYNITTYLIGGNHETISKGKDTYDYLEDYLPENIIMCSGSPTVLEQESTIIHWRSHCDLDVRDFNHESDWYHWGHVLVTHFRTTVGDFIREEIDTKKLCTPFDLIVAGDIHSDLQIDNLVYTNQPINTQFEIIPNTGYLLLEIDKEINYRRIETDLPSLIQINTNTQELSHQLTLVNQQDFYRINVEGTLQELRTVKVSLPNVKLNRIPILENIMAEDATELKVENLPLDAQIVEYLKLLKYSDSKVNDLLDVWKEL